MRWARSIQRTRTYLAILLAVGAAAHALTQTSPAELSNGSLRTRAQRLEMGSEPQQLTSAEHLTEEDEMVAVTTDRHAISVHVQLR